MDWKKCNSCGNEYIGAFCGCTKNSLQIVALKQKIEALERSLQSFAHKSTVEIAELNLEIDRLLQSSYRPESDVVNPIFDRQQENFVRRNEIENTPEVVFEATEVTEPELAESSISLDNSNMVYAQTATLENDNEWVLSTAQEEIVDNIFSEIFGPISQLFGSIGDIINSYKKENKLPILLLTSAGVFITLLGLGFLLQYSFQNWFGLWGNVVKVGLGFIASGLLYKSAIKIYHKDEKYVDYGSALLGLSLVLNYLLIYFTQSLGNVIPILGQATVGFGFILLNTAFAGYTALKFQTKIVALVSYIGGAFCPFYLGSGGNPWFYLSFLFVLTFLAFRLAKQINWLSLSYVVLVSSTVITTTAFSSLAFNTTFECFASILLVQAYFLLFVHFTIFSQGLKLKESLNKLEISIVITSISLLIGHATFLHFVDFYAWPIPVTINALVFAIGLFINWNKITIDLKKVLTAVTAFLAMALVPMYFNADQYSFVWALEGFVLLYLGFSSRFTALRIEAYIILIIAFLKTAPLSSQIDIYNAFNGIGIIALLSLGVILVGTQLFWHRNNESLLQIEMQAKKINETLIPFWAMLFVGIVFFSLIGPWYFPLGVLFSIAFLAFSIIKSQESNQALAWFSMVFIGFFGFGYSAQETYSLAFYKQFAYAKASIILVFSMLWAAKYFYQKWQVEYVENKRLDVMRDIFYLALPLTFIPWVLRLHIDYLVLALLVSLTLNSIIVWVFKKRIFVIENLALLTIISALALELNKFLEQGLVLGFVVLFRFLFIKRRRFYIEYYKFFEILFWPFSFVFIGLLLQHFVHDFGQIWLQTLSAGFLVLLFAAKPKFVFHKAGSFYQMALAALLLFQPIIILKNNSIFLALEYCVFVAAFVLLMSLYAKNYFKVVSRLMQVSWLYTNVLVVFAYLLFLGQLGTGFNILSTVLFAVHSVVLLLSSLNLRFKFLEKQGLFLLLIALLKLFINDLNGLDLLPRILVFTLTGLVLLVSAFLFIKLKRKTEVELADSELIETEL